MTLTDYKFLHGRTARRRFFIQEFEGEGCRTMARGCYRGSRGEPVVGARGRTKVRPYVESQNEIRVSYVFLSPNVKYAYYT
jgi:hypothetical protein